MDDLLAARSQMAMSLAFHIIFAAIGIAMPLLMIIAEWKWLRSVVIGMCENNNHRDTESTKVAQRRNIKSGA